MLPLLGTTKHPLCGWICPSSIVSSSVIVSFLRCLSFASSSHHVRLACASFTPYIHFPCFHVGPEARWSDRHRARFLLHGLRTRPPKDVPDLAGKHPSFPIPTKPFLAEDGSRPLCPVSFPPSVVDNSGGDGRMLRRSCTPLRVQLWFFARPLNIHRTTVVVFPHHRANLRAPSPTFYPTSCLVRAGSREKSKVHGCTRWTWNGRNTWPRQPWKEPGKP